MGEEGNEQYGSALLIDHRTHRVAGGYCRGLWRVITSGWAARTSPKLMTTASGIQDVKFHTGAGKAPSERSMMASRPGSVMPLRASHAHSAEKLAHSSAPYVLSTSFWATPPRQESGASRGAS